MNALVPIPTSNAEVYRASTDAAGLCRDIVLKTAQKIQGRQYVKVEGWQAIAIAHGCAASADNVERVEDGDLSGYRAIGIVRRMSDGAEIARAEGFLGDDEKTWASRPVYARRAMVQTRAISRACRSAFAHVVVLIDANLSTTPAEEMGWDNPTEHEPVNVTPRQADPAAKPEEHGLFIACKAAIDIGETKADLKKWADDNEGSLAKIKGDEPTVYDAILAYWRSRLKAAPISLTPADEFGLAGDNVPEFN